MNNILAINIGSSSVKARYKTRNGVQTAHETGVEREQLTPTVHTICSDFSITKETVIVHRVVHGGKRESPTKITDALLTSLQKWEDVDEIHMTPELRVIRDLHEEGYEQYAVFDTSFHQSIPEDRVRYGIPNEYYESGVQKYGFHGLSVAKAASQREGEGIILHLGSGCSLTAVQDGVSMNTTMGFTPLDGPVMRTRPGRLDPGIVAWLQNHEKALPSFLNTDCGWESMADTHPFKQTVKSATLNDVIATRVFIQSVVSEFHMLLESVPRLQYIAFTGGIGENNAQIRHRICTGIKPYRVLINAEANQQHAPVISQEKSDIDVFITEAAEEQYMIELMNNV